jgi:DNA polymerase-4
MAEQVAASLQSLTLAGHTVQIKARFPDFTTVTRVHTATELIGNREAIVALLPELLDRAVPLGASVRLLGITVSGLFQVCDVRQGTHQMSLLDEILVQQ